MKTIQSISKGVAYLIKVDDADYGHLSQFKWTVIRTHGGVLYAKRRMSNQEGGKNSYMHHVIMGHPSKGMTIDHRDGDGLNNQRSNLRFATIMENSRNQGKSKRNTSGFKGVSWDASGKKWRAAISVNNKSIGVGSFADINDAARAYDAAARKYHGEFANTNFRGDG